MAEEEVGAAGPRAGAEPAKDTSSDSDVVFVADPSMSPVAGRVYELLGPVVATAGVELIDVDWNGGTLQVIVDHQDGVNIDALASVNRLVSPILDQHDPVTGRYTLEVSSPGVERPLRRAEHYRRAIGETVIVKTAPHVTPRRVKGTLTSLADGELTIDVTEIDGVDLAEVEHRTVAVDDIASARTSFDWGPTPKKGGKNPKGQKPKGQKPKNQKPRNQNPTGEQRTGGKVTGSKSQTPKSPPPAKQHNKIEQHKKEVDDE